MKRILLTICMIVLAINAFAYKSANINGNVSISAQRFEGNTYMIMKVEADKDKMVLPETILKFQLTDGTILRFESADGTTKGKSSTGMGWVGQQTTDKSDNYLVFLITNEQIELIKNGIKAAVINTIPEMYREKFSNSYFANTLYKILTDIQETDEF